MVAFPFSGNATIHHSLFILFVIYGRVTMSIENIKFMQDERCRIIGKAVCRLNTLGMEISRETIINTLHIPISETDDVKLQQGIQQSIDMFIITNGKFN